MSEQTTYERIEELKIIINTLKIRLEVREQALHKLISDVYGIQELRRVLPDILIDGMSVSEIFIYFNKKYTVREIREALDVVGAKGKERGFMTVYSI